MTPLNLIRFAEFSEKIPIQLTFALEKKSNNIFLKLFLSHTLDYLTSALIASTIVYFFNGQILDSFYTIGKVDQEFLISINVGFSLLIFPFIMFNYFFFSYFLNHGQSCGMYLVNKRIIMESKNYREASKWALHSSLMCLSLGLSYLFKRKLWDKFTEHDYLYNNLVTAQTYPIPIDLLIRLDEIHKQNELVATEWKKTA